MGPLHSALPANKGNRRLPYPQPGRIQVKSRIRIPLSGERSPLVGRHFSARLILELNLFLPDSRKWVVMNVVNISEKFSLFNDHWSPKRIGELNGQQVIIAKVQGEFVFHKHDDEDELFMVMKGQLKLEMRDQTVVINPGEFYIVPKGVEHKPVAEEETHLLLFEPMSTQHTGDVKSEITVENYEEI